MSLNPESRQDEDSKINAEVADFEGPVEQKDILKDDLSSSSNAAKTRLLIYRLPKITGFALLNLQ